MLRQPQHEILARQVVEALRGLQIPIDFTCPMSSSDKSSMFFMLGMAELQQQKHRMTSDREFKEDERVLPLTKVRVRANETGEGVYSFRFNPCDTLEHPNEFRHTKDKEPEVDELGPKDREMILSLNQMIQNSTASALWLVNLTRSILLKEVQQNMMNRYFEFLNAFTELMRLVVTMESNRSTGSTESTDLVQLAREVCKWIEGLPRYTAQVFEMWRFLCEKSMGTPSFSIYFDSFRQMVRILSAMTGQVPSLQQESDACLRSFLKVNHVGVLDFIKMAEFQNDWQAKWPILSEEALSKIQLLVQGREADLNFVFNLGTKEIQLYSTAKVLGSLIETLPAGPPKLEQDVHVNLMKIKEKMEQDLQRGVNNLVFVMRTLAKSITNWDRQSARIVKVFVDFTQSANMLHTSDIEAASALYIQYFKSTTSEQVITSVFGDVNSPFFKMAPLILQGLPLSSLIALLHNEPLPLRPILQDNRVCLQVLFLRFIKENQKALKEHKLLDYFFKGLDVDTIKLLLRDMLRWGKPQGIFMLIVVKYCRPDYLFEEEVGELLTQNWKDNDNLKDGLKQYFKLFPAAKDRILQRFPEHQRAIVAKEL